MFGQQATSGLGLDAQRAKVLAEIERRGWTLVETFTDAAISGKSDDRPGLDGAMAALESGQAGGLIVASLNRLSRRLSQYSALKDRFTAAGWNLVALDVHPGPTFPRLHRRQGNARPGVNRWH